MTLSTSRHSVAWLAALAAAAALLTMAGSIGAAVAVEAAGPVIAVQDEQESAEPQANPIAMSEDSVRAGRRVFGRFCRSCHGMRADGQGMTAPSGSRPANLVDEQWDHGSTDGEIFTVIREGVPPAYDMDAWEGRITDDDIWNIINFLRDLAAN
ncbi:MAG: cytochrome c [Acidobacteria bacterium]|nr:cytochrome c [Acidobacteriota bacterium]